MKLAPIHPALILFLFSLTTHALPADQLSFLTARDFTVGAAGSTPEAVAVADFDGDGNLDLAVGNKGNHFVTGSLAVLLGNGDGTFKPALQFPADSLLCLMTGDFNGDGKIDLAACTNSSHIDIFLGNGDGTFGLPARFATVAVPMSIAVGDFNGDGKLDLAATNFSPSTADMSIFLGNGDGTFASQLTFHVKPSLKYVVAADFNSDGKLDLAITSNGQQAGLNIFLGNGDGTFNPGDHYSNAVGDGALAVGDFNHDGRLDLAVSENSVGGEMLSIMTGQGDGTFVASSRQFAGAATTAVTAVDFNGDGKLDVALSSGTGGDLLLFIGNGDGTVQSAAFYATGSDPTAIAVGDFNQDQHPDFALTNGLDADVAILLGRSNHTFVAAQNFSSSANPKFFGDGGPSSVATADLNGDGKLDLVTGSWTTSQIGVLLGNGNGTFTPVVNYPVTGNPYSVVIADFNGDGKPDLAASSNIEVNCYGNTVAVLLNDGDGRFGAATNYPAPSCVSRLAVGDFNADGKLDIIAQNESGFDILLGNGNGTFQMAVPYSTPVPPAEFAVGDFNRDGKLDLIFIDSTPGPHLTLFFGNGDGSFQTPVVYSVGKNLISISAADLNGDGKLDLVVGDETTLQVSVLLGVGNGTFQNPVGYSVSFTFPDFIAIGDLNGDGRADLAVADTDLVETGVLSIFLGNGDGTFQPPFGPRVGGVPAALALGDFNHDGRFDVVTANYFGGGITMFLNSSK